MTQARLARVSLSLFTLMLIAAEARQAAPRAQPPGSAGAGGGLERAASSAPAGEAKPAEGEADKETAPAIVVEKGLLRNMAYEFRFPIPEGWQLEDGATGERMDLVADGCEDCLLRIMVSPGNTLPLKETAAAIREQIASTPSARLLGEEAIKVARTDGYTLVKEEPLAPSPPPPSPAAGTKSPDAPPSPGSAPSTRFVRARYVTFSRGDDKFYVILRSPKERFAADDKVLETLLARFHFGAHAGGWLRPGK